MIKLRSAVRNWYKGKYVPYENDPRSTLVFVWRRLRAALDGQGCSRPGRVLAVDRHCRRGSTHPEDAEIGAHPAAIPQSWDATAWAAAITSSNPHGAAVERLALPVSAAWVKSSGWFMGGTSTYCGTVAWASAIAG